MPETIHCRRCGKAIRVEDFKDMMAKLRRHYKKYHPIAFRRGIKRGAAKRKKKR